MKKQVCGVTRTWIHGCWKYTFIKPTWQTIWQYLLELNIWKTLTIWNSVTQLMLTTTKKLHKGVCPVFFHVYGVEKQIKLIPIVRSLGGGLELARKMHKEGFCSAGDTVFLTGFTLVFILLKFCKLDFTTCFSLYYTWTKFLRTDKN